jgi:hypothetical protein
VVVESLDAGKPAWEDDPGRAAWRPACSCHEIRLCVSRKDALVVGIKIYLREHEQLKDALRRLHKLTRFRTKGPFRWMEEASRAKAKKTYYLKPGFLRRMKRVK